MVMIMIMIIIMIMAILEIVGGIAWIAVLIVGLAAALLLRRRRHIAG